jgi:hypothetical protein
VNSGPGSWRLSREVCSWPRDRADPVGGRERVELVMQFKTTGGEEPRGKRVAGFQRETYFIHACPISLDHTSETSTERRAGRSRS